MKPLFAFVLAAAASTGAFAVPQNAEIKAAPVNVAQAQVHAAQPKAKPAPLPQVAENRKEFGSSYQRY